MHLLLESAHNTQTMPSFKQGLYKHYVLYLWIGYVSSPTKYDKCHAVIREIHFWDSTERLLSGGGIRSSLVGVVPCVLLSDSSCLMHSCQPHANWSEIRVPLDWDQLKQLLPCEGRFDLRSLAHLAKQKCWPIEIPKCCDCCRRHCS